MNIQTKNFVTQTPSAPAADAIRHFEAKFAFETDCWDVHAATELENPGFILIDVRSPELFARGHLPLAINIPHAKLTAERLAEYPASTLFVVYCSGPHCNGSSRGALRLAKLGRPVKEMIGGVCGWLDEGFALTQE